MKTLKPVKVTIHRPDMIPALLEATKSQPVRPRAKLDDFFADYADACTRTKPGVPLVPAETFKANTARCAKCDLYGRTGDVLRCNHVARSCSVLRPWRADEYCAAGFWSPINPIPSQQSHSEGSAR